MGCPTQKEQEDEAEEEEDEDEEVLSDAPHGESLLVDQLLGFAAPVRFWQLQTLPASSWQVLAAQSNFWQLLAAPGSL